MADTTNKGGQPTPLPIQLTPEATTEYQQNAARLDQLEAVIKSMKAAGLPVTDLETLLTQARSTQPVIEKFLSQKAPKK